MSGIGWDLKRLRLLLGFFFLALAVPTAILIGQASGQVKRESFHQHRLLAVELAERIDARIDQLVEGEDSRSFSDYSFLIVAGDPAANYVQRSPLSNFPSRAAIPGLIGYFQMDFRGDFSTPLVPPGRVPASGYGISGPDLNQRLALQSRVRKILSQNGLVTNLGGDRAATERIRTSEGQLGDERRINPGSDPGLGAMGAERQRGPGSLANRGYRHGQMGFDELSGTVADSKHVHTGAGALGRVEELNLAPGYQTGSGDVVALQSKMAQIEKRTRRKERGVLLETQSVRASGQSNVMLALRARFRLRIFDSDIEPFEFFRLDSGHFIVFRKVWRDRERYIQGMLLDSEEFVRRMIESEFRATALARTSDLVVAHGGAVLAILSRAPGRRNVPDLEVGRRDLLYRTRLSRPLSDLELIFTIEQLPVGPRWTLVTWLGGILAVVLCGGFFLMYRLGARQIEVARQQQDFVSAVSHELKTPLTSIRMYGEMLREGWVPEAKRSACYDFIVNESERLSRLIGNVLHLARMTRSRLDLVLEPMSVGELSEGIRCKVASLVEHGGYELRWRLDPRSAEARIRIDVDSFAQIVINLVDNALKFSAKSPRKTIDVGWRLIRGRRVAFSVRDYGPGIPKNQRKRIFRLFYRAEDESTRETAGTGIGLALVQRLALAMGAEVEVLERHPGAEFRILIPFCRDAGRESAESLAAAHRELYRTRPTVSSEGS